MGTPRPAARTGPAGPTARWMLALLLWVGLGPIACPAQDRGQTVLARFREARALAVDPTGRLYVADAGRDVVRVLAPDGTSLFTLGGTGARAGEFDGPLDLDPTNGQTLYVADAGNGQIQQFSAERQYLGALPVGPSSGEGERVFDDGRDGADVQGSGRPVAVVSTNSAETFVVEGREQVVVHFTSQGRRERLLGPASRLEDPVDLALGDDRRLYVADRGRGAILAYDAFGTFLERLPTGPLPDLRAVSVQAGRLWIVCADQVVVRTPESQRRHRLRLGAPLVGALPRDGRIFLLTEHRLLRRERW
ncbi:MAG: NHL repeat-containing protein [Salinibacter sp.]